MFNYQEASEMVKDVQGQYIWIIGASSGIGAALAIALSQRGANLILSARRSSQLEALQTQLIGANHKVLPLDIADNAQTKQAFQSISRLDRVIFLAAVYDLAKSDCLDAVFIAQSLQVNIGGAYNMLSVVRPYFEKQGHGQIALCASVAGYVGLPNSQPYASTKAAIINLAESLYVECKENNIDVKLINPGFVRTQLTDKNDFQMPMMIEPATAAEAIVKGLTSESFEIHFPKRFTCILKLLQKLPYWLLFSINKKLVK